MPINIPYSIQSINNELFITGTDGIYKLDKSFSLVKYYKRTGSVYTSIFHNQTADILYIASFGSNRIDLL
jgi:hypothetical protein